jgi:hypothetical protein
VGLEECSEDDSRHFVEVSDLTEQLQPRPRQLALSSLALGMWWKGGRFLLFFHMYYDIVVGASDQSYSAGVNVANLGMANSINYCVRRLTVINLLSLMA